MKNFDKKPVWQVVKKDSERIVGRLCNVRLAFVSITNPRLMKGTRDWNYSVCCLIANEYAKTVCNAILQSAKEVAESCKLPAKLKKEAFTVAKSTNESGSLFRQGEKFRDLNDNIYDGFEGTIVIQPKCSAEGSEADGFKPKVQFRLVDARNNPIAREDLDDRIYSGVFADVGITLKPYKPVGSGLPGVAKYLSGIRVIADGPRLGQSDPFDNVRDDIDAFGDTDDSDVESVGAGSKSRRGKTGRNSEDVGEEDDDDGSEFGF